MLEFQVVALGFTFAVAWVEVVVFGVGSIVLEFQVVALGFTFAVAWGGVVVFVVGAMVL